MLAATLLPRRFLYSKFVVRSLLYKIQKLLVVPSNGERAEKPRERNIQELCLEFQSVLPSIVIAVSSTFDR